MKKSRFSQQGTLLVALTSAQGLLAPYAFAVPSDYVISSQQYNVQIPAEYQTVHVTSEGTATGDGETALNVGQDAALTSLINDGIITARDGELSNTYLYGLQNQGAIDIIDNKGSITITGENGNYSSSAIILTATSTVGTLINSGTISGPAAGTYYSNTGYEQGGGISNSGTLGTLKNVTTGVISGRTGVNNRGNIDVLENDGIINSTNNNNTGYYYNTGAIYNTGTINTLHNTGTITSSYFGVYNIGQIDTLTNNGDITGSVVGVFNRNYSDNTLGSTSTIINNGTISGTYGV